MWARISTKPIRPRRPWWKTTVTITSKFNGTAANLRNLRTA